MALYIKNNVVYNTLKGIEHNGYITNNPTHEQMLNWGYELYTPDPQEEQEEIDIQDIKNQIKCYQDLLEDTDYIPLKSIEGYDCDTLYPGWRQQRCEWRDKINEYEEQLKELEEN